MTPEQIAALSTLVGQYGLPVVVIGILGWAYLTGKLVTPGQVAQLKEQLEKMTALFERERLDRIAAQDAVAKFAAANADVAEAVAELSKTVLTKPDPYGDRLEGRHG